MSDPIKCDQCGTEGRRRMGKIAPEGWKYAELEDETSGETVYVYACSEKCCKIDWKDGPGRLESDMHQAFLDVITKRPDRWTEHTIAVSDGDWLRFGSSILEFRNGVLIAREEA